MLPVHLLYFVFTNVIIPLKKVSGNNNNNNFLTIQIHCSLSLLMDNIFMRVYFFLFIDVESATATSPATSVSAAEAKISSTRPSDAVCRKTTQPIYR